MESTQLFHCSTIEALDKMHAWSQTPMPVSASSYYDSKLRVRLSGATEAVKAAIETVGGETMADSGQYWLQLKEHQLDFFANDKPLWRISLASDIESLGLPANYDKDDCLYEWGGALRWLKSDVPAELIQRAVAELDGQASLFRHDGHSGLFQPLRPGLMRIHQNLKHAFDPENILNPGKLYPEL